jgi:hypothetical protein
MRCVAKSLRKCGFWLVRAAGAKNGASRLLEHSHQNGSSGC